MAKAAASRTPLVLGALGGGLVVVLAALVLPGLLRGSSATGTPATVRTTQVVTVAPAGSSKASTSTSQPQQATVQGQAPASRDARVGTTGYVIVLDSLSKNSWTAAQVRAIADTYATRPNSFVVDSNATPGMNPGFWVIGDGVYPDEASADAACSAYGRAVSSDCYSKSVTITETSLLTGMYAVETSAEECQGRGASDVNACTAANDFVHKYMAAEKRLTANDILDWWTEPGYYFGSGGLNRSALQAAVTAPVTSGKTYLTVHLASYTASADGPVLTMVVPYRTTQGSIGQATVGYALVPGGGANQYRIRSISQLS